MLQFSVDVPADTAAKFLPEGKTRQLRSHFQIFDSSIELADFARQYANDSNVEVELSKCGGVNMADALRYCAEGDLRGVQQSDAYLSHFEDFIPETSRRRWFDDVAGAFPNVPAFIAGHPLAMRRRVLIGDSGAPLSIVIDIGADFSVSAAAITRRGAILLALVRALAARRPIELWACAGLDADAVRNASWTFCRIETAPLDLAHAAFILTHPAALRRVFWAAACAYGFRGYSPYDCHQKHRDHIAELVAPALTHASETLGIPRANSADQTVTDPKGWLKAKLAEFAPPLA